MPLRLCPQSIARDDGIANDKRATFDSGEKVTHATEQTGSSVVLLRDDDDGAAAPQRGDEDRMWGREVDAVGSSVVELRKKLGRADVVLVHQRATGPARRDSLHKFDRVGRTEGKDDGWYMHLDARVLEGIDCMWWVLANVQGAEILWNAYGFHNLERVHDGRVPAPRSTLGRNDRNMLHLEDRVVFGCWISEQFTSEQFTSEQFNRAQFAERSKFNFVLGLLGFQPI